MIICQHFLNAQSAKIGWQYLKSEGLTVTIPDFLKEPINSNKRADLTEARALNRINIDKPVIALSCLRNTQDEFGRIGLVNHTILIDEEDYARVGSHPEVFERKFLTKIDDFAKEPIVVNDTEIKKAYINDENLAILRRFFTNTNLAVILDNIMYRHRVILKITGVAQDSIRLSYALFKLLPQTLRAVPFINFPAPTSDYNLIIYASTDQNIFNATTRDFSDLAKNTSNSLFAATSTKDLGSIYEIQKEFDEIFTSFQETLEPKERVDLALREYKTRRIGTPANDSLDFLLATAEQYEKNRMYEKADNFYSQTLQSLTSDDSRRQKTLEGLIRVYSITDNFQKLREILIMQCPTLENRSEITDSMMKRENLDPEIKRKLAENLLKSSISGEGLNLNLDTTTYGSLRAWLHEEFGHILGEAKTIDELENGTIQFGLLQNLAKELGIESRALQLFTENYIKRQEEAPFWDFLTKWFSSPSDVFAYLEFLVSRRGSTNQEFMKKLARVVLVKLLSGEHCQVELKKYANAYRLLQKELGDELRAQVGQQDDLRHNAQKFEQLFDLVNRLDIAETFMNFNIESEVANLIKDSENSLLYIFTVQLAKYCQNFPSSCEHQVVGRFLEKYLSKLNEFLQSRLFPEKKSATGSSVDPQEFLAVMESTGLARNIGALLREYGTDKGTKTFTAIMESLGRAYAKSCLNKD